MANIKDVARFAGVSVATVSRVINNTVYVEPMTRSRVEKAMRVLNYRPNAAALALAKKSVNMLGLLTGNLDDPFFSRMARGVEEVTRKEGIRLIVCNGGHQIALEKDGLDFLINQGCEAIVAHLTRMSEEDILCYMARHPALVVINRYFPTIANRCVWLDNRSASQAATNLLIQNGHWKIACVTANISIDDRKQRLEGYQIAMDSAGIPTPDDWIIRVPFTIEGGELAAENLLDSRHAFTAVITFNDVMAAGIMRTLHRKKIKVPADISIVGFDDIVWAEYLNPPLTTMHYPINKMAKRAATLALQLNAGEVVLPKKNKYYAQLIQRDSVAFRKN